MISTGDRFAEELGQALDATDVFLLLLSPQWLASTWCRWEYDRFTTKERSKDRSPRLLPVLWVEVDERDLDDEESRRVAADLKTIVYDDWTALRHANISDQEVSSRIGRLAKEAKRLAAKE
jgi:hypothetical protein